MRENILLAKKFPNISAKPECSRLEESEKKPPGGGLMVNRYAGCWLSQYL